VLQGFRGELTLLDSRGSGGASSGGDYSADDAGGDFGSPGPTRKVPATAGARSGGDMDDEIPF
jgi:single-strand DNA-binding protein